MPGKFYILRIHYNHCELAVYNRHILSTHLSEVTVFSSPIPRNSNFQYLTLTENLRQLFPLGLHSRDDLVIAIPGCTCYHHFIDFPFSDPSRIHQIMKFSVEPYIPESVDEISSSTIPFDFYSTRNTGKNTTKLVTGISNKWLNNIKKAASDANLDFIGVIPDTMLFFDLILKKIRDVPFLAIEIGFSGLQAFYKNNDINYNYVTHSIAANAPEDRWAKHVHLFLNMLNQRINTSDLHIVVLSLLRRPTTEFDDFNGSNWVEICLRELSELRNELLKLTQHNEKQILKPASEKTLYSITFPPLWKFSNLIPDKFTRFSFSEISPQRWSIWVSSFLLMLILFSFTKYTTIMQKEKHLSHLKKNLRQEFQQAFPDTRRIVNELAQAKAALAQINKHEGNSISNKSRHHPLDILADFSQIIPKSYAIELSEFSYEVGFVKLSGLASDFKTIDETRTVLLSLPQVTSTKVVSSNVNSDNKVEFQISVALKEN